MKIYYLSFCCCVLFFCYFSQNRNLIISKTRKKPWRLWENNITNKEQGKTNEKWKRREKAFKCSFIQIIQFTFVSKKSEGIQMKSFRNFLLLLLSANNKLINLNNSWITNVILCKYSRVFSAFKWTFLLISYWNLIWDAGYFMLLSRLNHESIQLVGGNFLFDVRD